MSTADRRRAPRTTLRISALTLILFLGGTTSAFGFGTIRDLLLDQSNEHEHITRVALQCPREYLRSSDYVRSESTPLEDVAGRCFEPKTTQMLAGNFARLPEANLVRVGAVGAPDMDSFFDAIPHCTDGDFLPGGGYPQSRARARANLAACRAYLLRHFEAGLLHARKLVDEKSGAIVAKEATRECRFIDGPHALNRFRLYLLGTGLDPAVSKFWLKLGSLSLVPRLVRFFKSQPALTGQSAKCLTLSNLGRVLHVGQDFYAHSNWTDRVDKNRPVGVDNPPGLARTTRAPLLNPMTTSTIITPGLITACFTLRPIIDRCRGRIDHDKDLGKDKGTIVEEYAKTPPWENTLFVTGVSRKHQRSLHDGNFVRAVRGAVKESRGLWKDFGKKLARRYPRDGVTMTCILTRDNPSHNCRVRIFRYRVEMELIGGSTSWAHEFYRRSEPNYITNYRGSGRGSSSWKAEWRELQIRLNRTDRRVFSANTPSTAFLGRATGEWTDGQRYNEPPGSAPAQGHTCRYDHQESRASAARIGALPIFKDDSPHADDEYDERELFTLAASGPSVAAACVGFRTDPVRLQEQAYDGTYLCQFALDRLYEKASVPIRIPIARLGDDRITAEQSFQHTAGGCMVGGGIGDPTEYCDQSGFCWKGTKSRTGTLRVRMTMIKP